MSRPLRQANREYANDYVEKYLVIAGKWFLLVKESGDTEFSVLSKTKHPKLVSKLTRERLFGGKKCIEYYVNVEDPQLIEVSKIVNTPVFIVEGYEFKNNKYMLRIASEIPILANLGIPSIYKAEQLYQDLAYFIGNKMKDSPDLAPPVAIADKDRIVQHGFDLKKSFRNMNRD
jgi:hypothetical protein